MANTCEKPATIASTRRCEYHSCDFTFDELVASLPAVTATEHDVIPSNEDVTAEIAEAVAGPRTQWDQFFATNSKGSYKPRNYIYEEFFEHLQVPAQYFVEVGCGVGDTLYPLMNRLPGLSSGEYEYLATDFAENALETLRLHPLYDNGLRIRTACWDITLPFPTASIPPRTDVVLCIFALSALKPAEHIQAMFHMKQLLTTNGKILLRDYGIYDHTYFRHTTRLEENCFMRKDRTIAYYFTLAYIETLAAQVGLEVMELSYCSVYSRNRKLGTTMRRNFIHCVLKVP